MMPNITMRKAPGLFGMIKDGSGMKLVKYREDFRLVSSYIIKEISISNLDVLKGVGLEQTELQNQTYQEILEGLRMKYNTETGNTIVGELIE